MVIMSGLNTEFIVLCMSLSVSWLDRNNLSGACLKLQKDFFENCACACLCTCACACACARARARARARACACPGVRVCVRTAHVH